jgi:hypothetical protein
MAKTLDSWVDFITNVFTELFRITKTGGWVAFEVGEIQKKKLSLDEFVVPIGNNVGFSCEGILINLQKFTKTSNIWGVSNNENGTNTNRIVIFLKE